MKFRTVLIGLAMFLLLIFLPSVGANADSSVFTIGDWTYLNDEGTVSIVSYNGSSATVTVPESVTYNGTSYTIKAIGESAFAENKKLVNVTIPAKITTLGDCAFKNCTSLSSVTINGNLKDCSSYSVYSYDDCYSVFYNAGANANTFTVTFGSGVKKVPAFLFATGRDQEEEKYARVTKIVFANTVTDIGEYAFFGCYDLKEVSWGTGVCRIGDSAFERDAQLTSVTVSAAKTQTAYIKDRAFKDCTSLKSVTIKGDLEDCNPYSTYEYDESYSVFHNAGSRDSAFTVTFAEGVTKIPEYLFATGREKSDDTYAHITKLVLPSTITEIGACAFHFCYDLAEVTWGAGLETIGESAFLSTALSTLNLPGNVTAVGASAFAGCTVLGKIVLPASLTSLGDCAFKDCTALNSLSINGNLDDCSYYSTFDYCEGYAVFYNTGTSAKSFTVTFGEGVTRVPECLFATGREKTDKVYAHISKVVFSNTVTDIGEYAFYRCYDLKEVSWGTGVCRIETSAFEYDSQLTSVTLSKAKTKTAYLHNIAFKDCIALNAITINGNLEDCDYCSTYDYCEAYSVFYNSGMRGKTFTVTFGESVTKVPAYLFATGNDKSDDTYAHVTSVTMPASVKEIGEAAFYRCYDLKTVTIYGRNTVFDEDAFGDCPSTMTIKGYEGSTAQTYANQNGFKFVSLSMPVPKLTSAESYGRDIIVKWQKLSRATSYRVYRKLSGGSWKLISTVTATAYTDPTARAGSVYSYKVTAKVDGVWTEDSNIIKMRHLPFTDVGMSDTYFDEVNWAVNNGIINGTSKTTFSPDAPCTRYQLAAMLYKMAGKPAVSGVTLPFTDVATNASYYNAVCWAYSNGIISGTSKTTFSPNADITRYQVVQMLYKMAGKPSVSGTMDFIDVSKKASYYNAVLWAVQNNITKGTNATHFSPNAECKRYQMVVFLYKYNRLYHFVSEE